MGEGYCVDEDFSEFDYYYTEDLDMTAARCAQLCNEEALCIGLSWKHQSGSKRCQHWFSDGTAETLGASYNEWTSVLDGDGAGDIEYVAGLAYYDDDKGFDCYTKGIHSNYLIWKN